MKIIFLSILSIVISTSIYSQVGFLDKTTEILGDEKIYSTICIGFDDLNGDLKDDLFLLDKGKYLRTFIQGTPNQVFSYKEHLQVSANGDWAFISGDLNNDAVPEIICSGYEDGSQFLKFDGETYKTMFTTENIFSQNSNLVDFNNDGFLDFFVCNDEGENLTYINNGSGGMTQTKLIDFQTTPEDDMSGNYSSIFTDIDGDGDLDLYIGKCRGGVDDPNDPRRINTLYINNGDGTYTEKGEEFGLDNGAQSWSIDAGDVDNDGDTDIIIANHDRAHDLMINDGNGHFDRKTLIPGGYSSFAYQSFFCDFDNNGWLDIFITEPSSSFILFNDEMSFSKREINFSGREPFSGASGDLNSDGFPDLYLGFGSSFQSASNTADRILINETNTNNYLDINLIGTVSNRDAIGAQVVIFYGDKIQYREIIAGKSYGIMNSTLVHFGLGKTTSIDSIKVKWPSGLESLVVDIDKVNTKFSISEDGCFTSTMYLPNLELCGGDSISASLPVGYDNYIWSNGSIDESIWVSEPGWYSAQLEKDGCITYTSYFEVTEEIDLNPFDVLSAYDQVACNGDVVELTSHPGTSYQWSNGSQEQTTEVVESGTYSVSLQTSCNIYESQNVEILFVDAQEPIIVNDTIMKGESAHFTGESENLNWYQNKNDLEPIATGSEFTTLPLDESTTYFVGETSAGLAFSKSLMPIVPLNSVGDTVYTENEIVQFEVLEELFLNSVKVRTQKSGLREILIMEGLLVRSIVSADLNVGINTIPFEVNLVPGVYTLSTNSVTNQTTLGTVHPQLSYSTTYTDKDKRIEGYLEIADSELNPGVTPYFFDWGIDYGRYDCEPRVEVQAVVKMVVSTDDLDVRNVVYPNPTSGQISIETNMDLPVIIEVFDMSGLRVLDPVIGNQSYITLDLPRASGMYFLKLTNGVSIDVKKVYLY